jgi:hypothetical protein
MKKQILLVCFVLGMLSIHAQQNNGSNYTTALGVKIYPGAVSVKHFFKDNQAIEGLGFFTKDMVRVTGLYEIHNPLGSVEGLQWYIGGGGHFGFGNDNWQDIGVRAEGFSMGVDGVIGLDYKVKGAPLNLSFDWQPSFVLISHPNFQGGWGGLGIRYTF